MADTQKKEVAMSLKIELGHDPDDIVDVAVTCDCTWSKRRFTTPYGIAVVMLWRSGKMLDCEVLSKLVLHVVVGMHGHDKNYDILEMAFQCLEEIIIYSQI